MTKRSNKIPLSRSSVWQNEVQKNFNYKQFNATRTDQSVTKYFRCQHEVMDFQRIKKNATRKYAPVMAEYRCPVQGLPAIYIGLAVYFDTWDAYSLSLPLLHTYGSGSWRYRCKNPEGKDVPSAVFDASVA
ncbi:uncharacterized protein LOC117175531 [Belonocnema kinseyi]|uniref:uncharacterized protein LOC117175531 n=1 Tax=Belonocnema kinseyi TaxID=2817044 RepID=UPI00143D9AF1|nr:uncharacterized protein LOC117175531 [Belonocnema kinseyi]